MIPVLSLIVLVAVIALSVITKKNAGIIGLIAAYLFATFAAAQGVEINVAKIATGGWPMSVFFYCFSDHFPLWHRDHQRHYPGPFPKYCLPGQRKQ